MTLSPRLALIGMAFFAVNGCGGASSSPFGKTDGSADAAGGRTSGTGGATATGGVSNSGGRSGGSGGATASGGSPGSGGAASTGGTLGTGGTSSTGGTLGTGGAPSSGGRGGVSGSGTAGMSGGGRGGGGNGGRGGAGTPPCDAVTTVADCDARTDCHSVFVDPQTCGCAAIGCCAKFLRCAAGDRPLCTAPIQICDAVQPHCEGPYVIGYTSFCYEGCVRAAECAQ